MNTKNILLGLKATLALAPVYLMSAGWASSTAPTDPEIAAIVMSANKSEISTGQYAQSHSDNKKVKDFGSAMVNDHSALDKKVKTLMGELKISPQKNETSEKIDKDGKSDLATLKKFKGEDLNKTYAAQAIKTHQDVLDSLDHTLIPSAKNESLKALLVQARASVAAHLEHSKKIAAELNGTQ